LIELEGNETDEEFIKAIIKVITMAITPEIARN
jgi:hypothetical protein